MLEILPDTKDNLLAVRVSHALTIADFDQYRNLLRNLMGRYKETHLYYEMVDLDLTQLSPVAAIENGLFDVVHGLDYGRVAMVGEKKWQEWAAKLISPVKKKGVRYFDLEEKEEAMVWVQEEE
ncbi:STAS/SEC14 domain-containing protein [Pontibacter sp. SGAir0037]|uniref:STAS/SEC14 domain-containing protein n=1 Tax=Pontibacter sp. SGAir0037 TaxID=2571030 RepID=UPI0010CCB8DC|nr:STAS/SEC14 domain-containing protein [Pontibacter sp. SGAir0037]QCR23607.1 STAS/SEC14 domain-containing protein [Pontibacter sp. SGAir0037]